MKMWKLLLLLGSAFLLAGSAQAQEQALGDVARAQKTTKAKATGNHVLGEDELAQKRSRRSGNPATECDAACEAITRAGVESKAGQLGDEKWADLLAAGRDELEADMEWQELFPDIQKEACMTESEKARDPEHWKQAERRAESKIGQEARDVTRTISVAQDPKSSYAARERSKQDLQVRAVKLLIMKYIAEGARQRCGKLQEASSK